MEHKTEIERTRIGGFGSSDAKDIYSVGKNQTLNKTIKKRLGVLLGQTEKKNFSTQSTEYGNFIEDAIFNWLKDNPSFQGYEFSSNPYYEVSNLKYPFKCFNHIDIEAKRGNDVIWFEIKAVNGDKEKTYKEYQKQLTWHYWILNNTYPNNNIKLYLLHYFTIDKCSDFAPTNISLLSFNGNEGIMAHITSGLEYINNHIHSFEYKEDASLDVTSLPIALQTQLDEIYLFKIEEKKMKDRISSFTEKMYGLMTNKSIDALKTSTFNIVRISPTKSKKVNVDKLAKEFPDAYKACLEEISKKGYVTLKQI